MQRSHDYRFLVQRWRAVARTARLKMERLTPPGRFEVFCLRTRALAPTGGIYLSAGIHGDEPASSEALITWAEQNAARLRDLPLLVFPCLNPWGLVNNCRFSEAGDDLNRSFHRDEIPVIAAVKSVIAGHRFAVSLMLHEDYDGQGLYLYEIQRETPYWGEALLAKARKIIPIEGRGCVDGWKAAAGLVRRTINFKRFNRVGYPEAIWLHLYHSDRTFTAETPSEFALPQRVAAHVSIVEECVRRTTGGGSPRPRRSREVPRPS